MRLRSVLIMMGFILGAQTAFCQGASGVGDIGSSSGGEEVIYLPLSKISLESCQRAHANFSGTSMLHIITHDRVKIRIMSGSENACSIAFTQLEEDVRRNNWDGRLKMTVTPEGVVKNYKVVSKDEGTDLKGEIGASSCTFVGHATPAELDGFGCRSDLLARSLSCTDAQGLVFTTVGVCSQGQSAIDCFNGTHVSKNKDASTTKGAQ